MVIYAESIDFLLKSYLFVKYSLIKYDFTPSNPLRIYISVNLLKKTTDIMYFCCEYTLHLIFRSQIIGYKL